LGLPKAKLRPVSICPRSTFEHGGPGGSEGTEFLRIGIPEEVKINANRIAPVPSTASCSTGCSRPMAEAARVFAKPGV
jgi:hypothetical protein